MMDTLSFAFDVSLKTGERVATAEVSESNLVEARKKTGVKETRLIAYKNPVPL